MTVTLLPAEQLGRALPVGRELPEPEDADAVGVDDHKAEREASGASPEDLELGPQARLRPPARARGPLAALVLDPGVAEQHLLVVPAMASAPRVAARSPSKFSRR